MNGQVIKEHKSNYPNPVEFKANDILEIGREDEEYPGWIRVKSPDGNEGWAPMGHIEILNDSIQGIAKANYCARELDVKVGEKLQIENTLCGWHYATNSRSESGWVPQECVRSA
jgi:hypothetical protein